MAASAAAAGRIQRFNRPVGGGPGGSGGCAGFDGSTGGWAGGDCCHAEPGYEPDGGRRGGPTCVVVSPACRGSGAGGDGVDAGSVGACAGRVGPGRGSGVVMASRAARANCIGVG